MKTTIKIIWITAVVVVSISMLWFLLGTTAFFQRGIDLVTAAYYIVAWAPALLLVGLLILLLKKGWIPNNIFLQIVLTLVIIALSVFISKTLFQNVNTTGWLTQRVMKNDVVQITADGKYEYQIELINLFQRNSSARLYVKYMATGEEITIPLDIQTRQIRAITRPAVTYSEESRLSHAWAKLTPSETENVYILTTTQELKSKIESFEINMETRKSRIINTV